MAMYPDLKIVYFDAHGDINTPNSSLTGNKHGMVLSYVMDKGFDPTRLLYVGIRCLDKYEVAQIDKLGISYLTVGTPDLEGKVERFVGNCPTHISFDVDVLDASIMPWTGLPSKGGLTWGQVLRIADRIPNVVAVDVAELNAWV
jgi:arginase